MVLVPGFETTPKRNDALTALKDGIVATLDDATVSESTRGSSPGWTVTKGDLRLEMHEAFWQDQVQMLSDNKPWVRVFTGLWMSVLWLHPRTLTILRHSTMWLLFTIWGSAMLLLWLWGAVAVLLVSLGSLLPADNSTPIPPGLSLDLHALEHRISDAGIWMQHFWPWALASLVVAAMGIRLDVAANIADLARRFVVDATDGPVTIRTKLSRIVAHAVNSLTESGDDKRIIVGHSFGVVIAMEALTNGLAAPAQFISLGGFLAFLAAEFKRIPGDVLACDRSSSLTHWRDYYSEDDWFSGPTPIPAGAIKLVTSPIRGCVPFYQRFTTRAHGNYYNNPYALQQIVKDLS